MNRIPNHWARTMIDCGFTYRGEPSISRLADRAGLSVETTRRLIYGIGTPSAETVAKAKEALKGAPVDSWIGIGEVAEIYTGPTSSRLLDSRQRAALTELINSMVAAGDAGLEVGSVGASIVERSGYTLAARTGQRHAVFDEVESQDDGTMEPA